MEPREGDLTVPMPMPPRRAASLPPQSQQTTEPFPALPPVPSRQAPPRTAAPGNWTPQGYSYAPPAPQPHAARQTPRGDAQQRMPRAQALALTLRIKRWLIGGTLAAFVSLAALAAAHATGVTAQAGATSTGSGDNGAQPANNDDGGGGFFGTQPAFGSGGGSQSPMSGTGTS